MKVRKNSLLLIACIVWLIAGSNVLNIGIQAYSKHITALNIFLSVLVFSVFQYFVFGKLVKKHTKRITEYQEEKQFFLKFFDVKSFIIMTVMISGGIGLRASNIFPEVFIAVFYTGLGSSLLLAGILFGINYTKQKLVK